MADPVETAIKAALLARARDFATAQSVTLEEPNIPFTPPAAKSGAVFGKWLRAQVFPLPAVSLGVNEVSSNQHYGLLQISVFWGVGDGELKPSRLADAVSAHFKRETVISRDGFRIKITKVPEIASGRKDDSGVWWMVPVTIRFKCFAPNP